MVTGDPASPAVGRAPRCALWALFGLLLTLASPASFAILVDSPFVRRTAAPVYLMMALGLAIGLAAMLWDRRIRVRLMGGSNIALAALYLFAFFVLAALPEATVVARAESAPDFTIPDQDGKPVSLREVRAAGPVLLVFYRGQW